MATGGDADANKAALTEARMNMSLDSIIASDKSKTSSLRNSQSSARRVADRVRNSAAARVRAKAQQPALMARMQRQDLQRQQQLQKLRQPEQVTRAPNPLPPAPSERRVIRLSSAPKLSQTGNVFNLPANGQQPRVVRLQTSISKQKTLRPMPRPIQFNQSLFSSSSATAIPPRRSSVKTLPLRRQTQPLPRQQRYQNDVVYIEDSAYIEEPTYADDYPEEYQRAAPPYVASAQRVVTGPAPRRVVKAVEAQTNRSVVYRYLPATYREEPPQVLYVPPQRRASTPETVRYVAPARMLLHNSRQSTSLYGRRFRY